MTAAQAFFLDAPHSADQRYVVFHPPQGLCRGRVLYLHPFAEEMNKARRMAALQARALAEQGFAVLQMDMHGCGDSDGDFSDASWQTWIQDGELAVASLNARAASDAPLTLWGLRAGCLIAVELAARLQETCNFCFWQPSTQGKLLLQQFLRLKMAAALIDGAQKGVVEQARQSLAQGQTVEVAGYGLSPALAAGLEAASLHPPPLAAGKTARLLWAELSHSGEALMPASQAVVERWRAAGYELTTGLVSGPAFWQTTETEVAPGLLTFTQECFA